MKFDKSKVYTTLNADELKIGSKVYIADNLADLRHMVETDSEAEILSDINPDQYQDRFCVGGSRFYEGTTSYALAYLVEAPEEEK